MYSLKYNKLIDFEDGEIMVQRNSYIEVFVINIFDDRNYLCYKDNFIQLVKNILKIYDDRSEIVKKE